MKKIVNSSFSRISHAVYHSPETGRQNLHRAAPPVYQPAGNTSSLQPKAIVHGFRVENRPAPPVYRPQTAVLSLQRANTGKELIGPHQPMVAPRIAATSQRTLIPNRGTGARSCGISTGVLGVTNCHCRTCQQHTPFVAVQMAQERPPAPEFVKVKFVPLDMRGGRIAYQLGMGHFQVCDKECYGFGPGHPPQKEPERPGEEIRVPVKNKERVIESFLARERNYGVPGVKDDCLEAVTDALKEGGAEYRDIEKVRQSGNFGLQSQEKGKRFEQLFKEQGL